jgi:AraC-like DNA-binding protein
LEARLEQRYDELSWHLVCRRLLSPPGAAVLLERLWRLDPGALVGPPPAARALPFVPPSAPAPRGGGISGSAAARARERAAEAPRQRLRDDAASLPDSANDCRRALLDVADHFFDEDLDGVSIRKRLEISNQGITSEVLFYLGDSLAERIERRHVEASLSMVTDCRFTLPRVGEELGMSPDRFRKAFKRRTGVEPKAVRATAVATAHRESRRLWLAVESGKLNRAQLRRVAGGLRWLQPEVYAAFVAQPPLAVRQDVDPKRAWKVALAHGPHEPESEGSEALTEMLATHQDYPAAQWYVLWVCDRLGRRNDVKAAWADWQAANRRLSELLELSPGERLQEVRRDPECQTDVFLWLLVDCVAVRLFHDAAESEHFADLAVAAAWARDTGIDVEGMRALTAALKANALRRRNELEAAAEKFRVVFGILAGSEVDPWIEGRIHSLYASLLSRQGKVREAIRALLFACSRLKQAGDQIERVRCVMDLCSSARVAKGRDPSQPLTACIAALDEYPFETYLRNATHLNRILSRIYLTDRLTGRYLATIKSLRAAMPPADSAMAAAQYQALDGVIAALEEKPAVAASILKEVASWYEARDLLGDAAFAWLVYAWVTLTVDASAAARSAKTAYEYMRRTGFSSHGAQNVALKIFQDAKQGQLTRGLLRRGILLMACPSGETRLASEAEPRY